MGLVGGGQGTFIGRVHATAAALDGRAVLVAGALSSEPAGARASAPDYDIPPGRVLSQRAKPFGAARCCHTLHAGLLADSPCVHPPPRLV
jgi:hypothetical protein